MDNNDEDDIMTDVTIDFNNVDKLIKKSNNTLTGVLDEIQILYTNVSNTNYAPGSPFNNLLTKIFSICKRVNEYSNKGSETFICRIICNDIGNNIFAY